VVVGVRVFPVVLVAESKTNSCAWLEDKDEIIAKKKKEKQKVNFLCIILGV